MAYTAAAAATGLVAANSAEAAIHYSGPVREKVRGRKTATFPLDAAGGSFVVRHFNFFYGSSNIFAGGAALFHVYAPQSASVVGVAGACHNNAICVSKLESRDPISAGPFAPAGGTLAWEYDGSFREIYGQFLERGIGLIGFKFNTGAGVQYGWVRVRMGGAPQNPVEVVDYAYGDPGDILVAGQKSEGDSPALESLGALALGATGLLAWRRRRRA